MKTAVIVCTYNAPRQLELVFEGISRQTRKPDELFIADDGSTPETTELVRAWADRLELPVHHVWHTDRGYRKPRIVNEAARRASAEHLIFLDGDSVPHSRWVEDHALAANNGRVLCGRRVKLGPELSPRVTRLIFPEISDDFAMVAPRCDFELLKCNGLVLDDDHFRCRFDIDHRRYRPHNNRSQDSVGRHEDLLDSRPAIPTWGAMIVGNEQHRRRS